MSDTELLISPMRSDELAFVASGIKKSMRHSKEYADQTNFRAYAEINPLVNALLTRADVLVGRVRGGREAAGFIVYEPSDAALLVGFVYAKHAYRRRGVAKSLLAEALEFVPATAALKYLFPTERFARLAAGYGFEIQGAHR